MIEFRQKDFSIQEGHYTGPKDQDKVPGAIEVIGKSALGGALAGSAIGAVIKDTTAWEGAKTGAKIGGIGGIILKFFINYLHKPMSKVKFQEVDRNIRREFGIYRAAGITVGDTVGRRADVDERFSFSDRQVSKYKINFAVQDNKITMYTFDLTQAELDKLDKILDYYCKKYTGMEYNSSVINYKLNSYAIDIIFTNYQVISNFIMEISQELGCKINLLDNRAMVQGRLTAEAEESIGEEESRNFSKAGLSNNELLKILGKSGRFALVDLKRGKVGRSFSSLLSGFISGLAEELSNQDLIKLGYPAPRESHGSQYISDTLKKLGYIPGHHYLEGQETTAPINISMISGLFIVTADKGKVSDKVDKIFSPWKLKMGYKDTGRAIIWTYPLQSRKEFETILGKLMKVDEEINLFEN